MKLIIGLGNPGKEYIKTRHNAGFIAVDRIRNQELGIREWKFDKKFNAELAEVKIDKEKVMLVKPQTFMNKSGDAVGKLVRFYKIKPADIIIVHDELDLPLGTLRLKIGGGAAGHKGLESVIKALKTQEFARIRIGIAPKTRRPRAMNLVLGKFSPAENKKLDPVLKRVAEAIAIAVTEGVPKSMTLYNR